MAHEGNFEFVVGEKNRNRGKLLKYMAYSKEWWSFNSYWGIYFPPYKSETYTVSSGNCPRFSCAISSSLLMLIVGPRDQFPRWRRSRRRLSVCSILRCPDLWLQRSAPHKNNAFLYCDGSARETWVFLAVHSLCYSHVGWEINFFIIFEIAPFFCICLVDYCMSAEFSRALLFICMQYIIYGTE
jgi:hypothetical protein